MLWYYAPALVMLLQSAICVPRGKVTEKPEVHPKHRKATHISEFTDPDTGLNPFLDLEEGRTSLGRNGMEDERTNDEPYIGVNVDDLIEGDSSDRRWNLEEPKEYFGRSPGRWSELDIKEENHFVISTTPLVPPSPPTTVELFVTKDLESAKSEVDEEDQVQQKVKKEEKESFVISKSTVIYASVTIAIVTAVAILVGACWWRKKLKTSRSTSSVENSEVKS